MAHDKTSIIMTLFVVGVLVLASQTQAVSLDIKGMPGSISLGETAEFEISVDIKHGERIPITRLKLNITDERGKKKVCWFLPDGTQLQFCPGIKVKRIYTVKRDSGDRIAYDEQEGSEQDYGYGWGFGYGYGDDAGELRYKVTADSSIGVLKRFGTGTDTFTMEALVERKKGSKILRHTYMSDPVDLIVVPP